MRKIIGKVRNETKAKELRRKLSARKKINGTADRPRICATKSNKNLFVQVIDDVQGVTLFSVQTFGKNATGNGSNAEGAAEVGKTLSSKLKERKIETAVFDRNGKKYTGVVAKLADAIRENGIRI